MFGDLARETIGGMPELLVRIDWVDDLPDGTVQDARTQESIAFAGWIELAAAIRRLTGEVNVRGTSRDAP
jgi:hypothetical protein